MDLCELLRPLAATRTAIYPSICYPSSAAINLGLSIERPRRSWPQSRTLLVPGEADNFLIYGNSLADRLQLRAYRLYAARTRSHGELFNTNRPEPPVESLGT